MNESGTPEKESAKPPATRGYPTWKWIFHGQGPTRCPLLLVGQY